MGITDVFLNVNKLTSNRPFSTFSLVSILKMILNDLLQKTIT